MKLKTLDECAKHFTNESYKYYKHRKRAGMIHIILEHESNCGLNSPKVWITYKFFMDKIIRVEFVHEDGNELHYTIYDVPSNQIINSVYSEGLMDMNAEYYSIVSTEEEYFQQSLVDDKCSMYSVQSFKDLLDVYDSTKEFAIQQYKGVVGGSFNPEVS